VVYPQQEHPHLAEQLILGQPLLVVVHTDRLLADDATNQAGFFECFPRGDLGRLEDLSSASLSG
jgi:hypothetical protein